MKIIIKGEKPGVPMKELGFGDTFRFLSESVNERSTPKRLNRADIYMYAQRVEAAQYSGRTEVINLTHGTVANSLVSKSFVAHHRVEPVECVLHVEADWR